MTTLAIEKETNDYWSLIKNASKDVKLALISKISASLVTPHKKVKHKVCAADFAGLWSDEDYPEADEMAKEIRDARHFPDRMEKYL